MSIGRGVYDVDDVRDGDSLIDSIEGASVSVYGPFSSPNNGNPDIQIGDPIDDDVLNVVRINEANGQTLVAPNKNTINDTLVRGVGSNQDGSFGNSGSAFKWRFRNNTSFRWFDYFEAGDVINITGSSYTISGVNGGNAFDLDGVYTVLEVFHWDIVVENANLVNSNWDFVNQQPIYETNLSPITASLNISAIIGPFFLDYENANQFFVNLIAQNGIYKDSGTNQTKEDVEIRIEITPADSSGNNNGTPEIFDYVLEGSVSTRDQRAITAKITPAVSGRVNMRLWRTSETDRDFNGSVVDEVKVRDIYAVTPVDQNDFGNITTIHSKTFATTGAPCCKK